MPGLHETQVATIKNKQRNGCENEQVLWLLRTKKNAGEQGRGKSRIAQFWWKWMMMCADGANEGQDKHVDPCGRSKSYIERQECLSKDYCPELSLDWHFRMRFICLCTVCLEFPRVAYGAEGGTAGAGVQVVHPHVKSDEKLALGNL